jgi:hypothetical protein
VKKLVSFLSVLLLTLSLVAVAPVETGAADVDWSCYGGSQPWLAGQRAPNFSGNLAAAHESTPAGLLAVLTSDTRAREFRLWLYDGDDTYLTVPYSQVAIESGTQLPTGRIDPVGNPLLVWDQGMLKILFVAWNGGGDGPQPLVRVYTWCGIASS